MKRLLCIVGSMDVGGAETFLMKIYRKIDRTKYQMDFYVLTSKPGFYDKEIKILGGRIFCGTAKSNGFFKYAMGLKQVIQENKYDYVLRMSQNSLAALDLAIARCAGAKRVIFRSTNSHVYGGQVENIIHRLFRPIANKIIDVKIAPSKEAAAFMFGPKAFKAKNVFLLNNGIDMDVYRFNTEKRNEIRKELGIQDCFVIGHIGRFSFQKNHVFLISVFQEVLKRQKNAALILLGTGECEQQIKDLVQNLGLNNQIRFIGVKPNTSDYYSAMDFFVFPSLYEGMPNTVIEAQASGLPCLVSDAITKNVRITEQLSFLGLQQGADKWADAIIQHADMTYERSSDYIMNCFVNRGFSIDHVVNEFIELFFGS